MLQTYEVLRLSVAVRSSLRYRPRLFRCQDLAGAGLTVVGRPK
jgi:hypothetical protein